MKFTKMHGLGNDYVYVSLFDERIDNPSGLASTLSDRHIGIGSDGLILLGPSVAADVRMVMYNADGSRGRMCGNGIRCAAKYAVEHGLAVGPVVRIETDGGVRRAECLTLDGVIGSVRVDMVQPVLDPSAIPTTLAGERIVDQPLRVGEAEYRVTCVSMGNPHAVIFVEHLDSVRLDVEGPRFERASEFPERINAHFVRLDSTSHVTMRTWERGSGETRACGTGACAVCVAGVLTARTRRQLTVTLPGGDLEVEWSERNDHVYMTGPAVEVFSGVWPGQR